MNDIELTAAAAHAAGYNVETREGGTEFAVEREGRWFPFAPIDDDGDAFRLLIDLRIRWGFVTDDQVEAAAPARNYLREMVVGGDVRMAVRRALVRAAAALEADR